MVAVTIKLSDMGTIFSFGLFSLLVYFLFWLILFASVLLNKINYIYRSVGLAQGV